jgi:hypothetical protein
MDMNPQERADFFILGWDEQVLRGLRELKARQDLNAWSTAQNSPQGETRPRKAPPVAAATIRPDCEPG